MENLEITNNVAENDIEGSNESEKDLQVEFGEEEITIKGNREQVMELMEKIMEATKNPIKYFEDAVSKEGVIYSEEINLSSGMIYISGLSRKNDLELRLGTTYGDRVKFNKSAKEEIEEVIKRLIE